MAIRHSKKENWWISGLMVPAHLRRRASAQAATNRTRDDTPDRQPPVRYAERARVSADAGMTLAQAIRRGLNLDTLARCRQVQPGVRRPLAGASRRPNRRETMTPRMTAKRRHLTAGWT